MNDIEKGVEIRVKMITVLQSHCFPWQFIVQKSRYSVQRVALTGQIKSIKIKGR